MAAILAEQMRQLANRIDELAQNEELPQGALEGSLNARQLAELLGIDDLNTFTRSINKIKRGDADKLTRVEMIEMAIAFVNLLAAQPEDTTKAMTAIRRVSSKEEPVMEADSALKVTEIPMGYRYTHQDGRYVEIVGDHDEGEWEAYDADGKMHAGGDYHSDEDGSGDYFDADGLELNTGLPFVNHEDAAAEIFKDWHTL